MNRKVSDLVDRLDALLASRASIDEAMVLVKEALREIAEVLDRNSRDPRLSRSDLGGPGN